MATQKQEKYLRRLKLKVGLKQYRVIQKRMGLAEKATAELSTREASRLISALRNDIERQKTTAFRFALQLHAPLKVTHSSRRTSRAVAAPGRRRSSRR